MTEFDKLPSRIKYYILDYKDIYLDEVKEKFGKSRLRDFTKKELSHLYNLAVKHDLKSFE